MKIVRLSTDDIARLNGKRFAKGTEPPPFDCGLDDETFVGVIDDPLPPSPVTRLWSVPK